MEESVMRKPYDETYDDLSRAKRSAMFAARQHSKGRTQYAVMEIDDAIANLTQARKNIFTSNPGFYMPKRKPASFTHGGRL
jgi:hypothetical protein